MARNQRTATVLEKWTAFYRLLAELQPSDEARRARSIVFGGVDPKSAPREPQVSRAIRKVRRHLQRDGFMISNPGVTVAKLCSEIGVDRADWYRYFRGELDDSSVVSERIIKKICG